MEEKTINSAKPKSSTEGSVFGRLKSGISSLFGGSVEVETAALPNNDALGDTETTERLVAALRTVNNGVASVSVQNSNPVNLRFYGQAILDRRRPGKYAKTNSEQWLLNLIHFVKYGQIYVLIEDGAVVDLLTRSYQQIRLSDPLDF